MRITLLAAAAPIALLAACTGGTPGADASGDAADETAVMEAIGQVESAQLAALNARDPAGASAPYTADATVYVTGSAPVSGSAAIQAMFAEMFSDPAFAVAGDDTASKSWVAASGDLAATSFTGTWTHTVGDTVATEPLAVQTVWQKQADGSWKIVSDMNLALPETLAATPPVATPTPAPTPTPSPT